METETEMTYTINQQVEALRTVIQEKRTGEVELANALEAALKTLVAKAATAGAVSLASEQVQAPAVPATLYKQFEARYHEFCRQHTGMDGRMDGGQGKALNEIIAYLTANCRTRDAAGALASWDYLFKHWGDVGEFLAKQKSLVAINKYLVELLETIRKANMQAVAKPVDPRVAARKRKLASEIDDARLSLKHFQTCAPYAQLEQHRAAAEAALHVLQTGLNQLG